MIRSIIVDDEQPSRELLADLLSTYCHDVTVVASVGTIADALEAIDRYRPDLVFLDIELPRGNGFELLEAAGHHTFEVIFITAFEQYALRAIRASALDYLLKPLNYQELVAAVAKTSARVGTMEMRSRLETLIESLQAPQGPMRVALPTDDGLIIVATADVVRCEAEGSYTWFHMHGERRLVSRPLKEFEAMLSESGFLRIHHSHLVNVAHIRRYVRGEGGEVVMSDNSTVLVARRKKEELMKALGAISARARK